MSFHKRQLAASEIGYDVPNGAMRHESEPRLTYEGHDTCPVEKETRREMGFHVMPMDMVYNEWECVQKGENEEGIRNPSMENLQSFVSYPSD